MPIQQALHILALSIPLYHSTRPFQFINMCEEFDRTFLWLLKKKKKNYHQL